jgi:hypothetical protein
VLAGDTAKEELRQQAACSGESLEGYDLSGRGLTDLAPIPNQLMASTAGIACANPDKSQQQLPKMPPSYTEVEFGLSNASIPFWSQVDRLEMAAQKLNLAR